MGLGVLFLDYLVVSTGLAWGVILSKISPEEMDKGKAYFRLIKFAVAIIISVLGAVSAEFILILLGLGLIAVIYYDIKIIDYLILGIVLAAGQDFLLFASLAFIYGLAAGSYLYDEESRRVITVRSIAAMLAGLTIFLF